MTLLLSLCVKVVSQLGRYRVMPNDYRKAQSMNRKRNYVVRQGSALTSVQLWMRGNESGKEVSYLKGRTIDGFMHHTGRNRDVPNCVILVVVR